MADLKKGIFGFTERGHGFFSVSAMADITRVSVHTGVIIPLEEATKKVSRVASIKPQDAAINKAVDVLEQCLKKIMNEVNAPSENLNTANEQEEHHPSFKKM